MRLSAAVTFLLCSLSVASAQEAAAQLKLEVTGPARPVLAGQDITLDLTLSSADDKAHEFPLGAFPQVFGVYLLGPWGPVPSDATKVRPENWMHQQHSTAAVVTVAPGKPYRTTVKLSDYFKVGDAEAFRVGDYQVNVKFYATPLRMAAPIDSGPVRFTVAPKK